MERSGPHLALQEIGRQGGACRRRAGLRCERVRSGRPPPAGEHSDHTLAPVTSPLVHTQASRNGILGDQVSHLAGAPQACCGVHALSFTAMGSNLKSQVADSPWIVDRTAPVLVTGAAGFVGSRVVEALLRLGFEQVVCGVRRSSDLGLLQAAIPEEQANRCQILETNLLSREECRKGLRTLKSSIHLVAGRGKSFPGCFQGSVVTTRNLLDALLEHGRLKRFVNVSSFAVYSNFGLRRGAVWDETCPLEDNLDERHDAYVYGKLRQDELVQDYHQRFGVPFTIVRPGIVFGPGKKAIPGFVGHGHVRLLHAPGRRRARPADLRGQLRGGDRPRRAGRRAWRARCSTSWTTNCPRAGPSCGPTSGRCGGSGRCRSPTLRPTPSARCGSGMPGGPKGQLPPVFNRRMCAFAWKGNRYSNRKLKERLGWQCRVPMQEALQRYFEYQKNG